MIKFDFNTYNDIELKNYDLSNIMNKFLLDNKMADWYYLNYDTKEIKKYAEIIIKECDIFIIVGIGGSFLGSKAVIDLFSSYFNDKKPEIIYVGNNLSSDYINDLLNYINNKKVCINVISKSGNTLETLLAYDILLKYMKENYDDYSNRIIITTNNKEGELLKSAKDNGFKLFEISQNTPGRYSVLSTVGLLPMAVAGINIDKILLGAKKCQSNLENCYKYTYLRNEMQKKDKYIESFDVYEPKLYCLTEWIKQLFAESQGKNSKAIFPVSTINTRDLHSIEQYYKAGKHMIFSTTLYVNSKSKIEIKRFNKDLNAINKIAMESVLKERKKVINSSLIELDSINEEDIGYLIFFFEICAMLGSYLINVNYYDQPDVNSYKDIMNSVL